MSFRLEFEHQGELQEIAFDQDSITIGRDRSSDFVLDHPTVSRQHALVVQEGPSDFRLVVLSRGGMTALDGQRVETDEVELYDGAMVQLGQYSVRFRSEEAPSQPVGNQGASSAGAGMAGHQAPVDDSGQDDLEGEPQPAESDESGNIQSWDEIAADDSGDDTSASTPKGGAAALKEARSSDDDEETSPLIVAVGLVGAVGMLGFAVVMGLGGDSGAEDQQEEVAEEEVPVEVTVDCYDETSCYDGAEAHYERGIDLIEREVLETGNLFEGYHRLVKASAYLEEGGIEEIPEEMSDLEEEHDRARERLDDQFREFRVRFHQADQRDRHEEMARILDEVEDHFPDRTAQENQWAREERRLMQREGIYPTTY